MSFADLFHPASVADAYAAGTMWGTWLTGIASGAVAIVAVVLAGKARKDQLADEAARNTARATAWCQAMIVTLEGLLALVAIQATGDTELVKERIAVRAKALAVEDASSFGAKQFDEIPMVLRLAAQDAYVFPELIGKSVVTLMAVMDLHTRLRANFDVTKLDEKSRIAAESEITTSWLTIMEQMAFLLGNLAAYVTLSASRLRQR